MLLSFPRLPVVNLVVLVGRIDMFDRDWERSWVIYTIGATSNLKLVGTSETTC